MRKVFYLSTALLLTACGQDDGIAKHQNKLIRKDSPLTYGEATKQYKFCTEESKKWTEKSQREEAPNFITFFTCDLTQEAFASYNDKLKAEAEKKRQPPVLVIKGGLTLKIVTSKDPKRQRFYNSSQEAIATLDNGKTIEIGFLNDDFIQENRNPFTSKQPKKYSFFN